MKRTTAGRTAKKTNGGTHIGGLIDGAEAVVAATANVSEHKLSDIRERLEEDLEAARAYLESAETRLVDGANGANDYVHANPWPAIGVAAGAGVLAGVVVGAVAFRR